MCNEGCVKSALLLSKTNKNQMISFKIAKYKGKSNAITQFGKHYLILPNNEKTSRVYCEYNHKHLKIDEKPICIEANRDLEFGQEFDVDYLYEKEGKILFVNN